MNSDVIGPEHSIGEKEFHRKHGERNLEVCEIALARWGKTGGLRNVVCVFIGKFFTLWEYVFTFFSC